MDLDGTTNSENSLSMSEDNDNVSDSMVHVSDEKEQENDVNVFNSDQLIYEPVFKFSESHRQAIFGVFLITEIQKIN